MNSDYPSKALIGPYTLMENEALVWSLLLFQQTVLLHPFPLPLPESFYPLIDQGWLEVRLPDRSPEEIREKDKKIRELETFLAGMPEQSFLKYLHEVSLQGDWETQEEILGRMRGRPIGRFPEKNEPISGQLLLCLIHSWIWQQWALEEALRKVEEQEQRLAQSWQENSAEGDQGNEEALWQGKNLEIEIPCPLALKAWIELKNKLVPEPVILFTSQSWVWKNHFGNDWEESPTVTLSLPELPLSGPNSLKKWMEKEPIPKTIPALREAGKRLFRSLSPDDSKDLCRNWDQTLSLLGLPSQGRYQLILPLIPSSPEPSTGSGNQNNISSLLLIIPK